MITKKDNMIILSGKIDSNNAKQFEDELLAAAGDNAETVTIDAKELEYISSAGLRVFLKLKKGAKGEVSVVNVSKDVYDIFEVTGFTELLNVKKVLRELSIYGMKLIGKGATGSVYRADEETIIKVFNENVSLDLINRENVKAKNAFIFGVSTAISYDMVKVGKCYGVVYEMLNAEDLLNIIRNDKAHMEEYIRNFAVKMRQMNEIEVDDRFEDTKVGTVKYLGYLEGKFCTSEEVGKLRAVIENVPDRNTFIHGDAHIGNVMLQNGEYMFIDLSTSGKGHPIFDMVSMYMGFKMGQRTDEETRKNSELIRGFTNDELELIWNTYLKTYLDTKDGELIKKAEEQIKAITGARVILAAISLPGHFKSGQIEYFKNTAIEYYDKGMEQICF